MSTETMPLHIGAEPTTESLNLMVAAQQGDRFTLPPLVPGILTDEVVAECERVQDGTAHFTLTTAGIFLARGRAFLADGKPRFTILD